MNGAQQNVKDLIRRIDQARKPAPIPAVLTVQEVADLLRVHHQVIRRAIDRRELEALRVGTQLRIRRQDLSAYLRRQQPGGKP